MHAVRRFTTVCGGLVTAVGVLVLALPALGAGGGWTRQFGTSGLDEAKGVAVDAQGASYVVGETFGTLPGQTAEGTLDAFVRKYDATGAELWTRQFGAWERDIAWGIAIDPAGFAYVVGQTEGRLPGQTSAGGVDAFLRKYDLSGTELWTRQFGGPAWDVGSGVTVSPAGDVYIVGTTSSVLPGQQQAGSFDAFVRRYDPAGNEVWTRQFGTPAGDNARRVGIDHRGRVLVVGSAEGALPGQVVAGAYDAFVSMYDPDGSLLWVRQFGSRGDDFGVAVDSAPNGHISVAGSADQALPGQTSPGGTSAFLRHFDVNGTALWTDQFGTGVSDDAWDVAVDGDGSAYLVGTTEHVLPGQRSAGRSDAFVRQYNAAGRELRTRQYGTAEGDQALAVALDPQGGIVIAGGTRGRLAPITRPGSRTPT